MILAGDVGGTKVRLALAAPADDGVEIVHEARFESDESRGLKEVARTFLSDWSRAGGDAGPIERACFGIAGPVVHGEVEMTNLPWELDPRALGDALGIPDVRFLNDLEAMGYGLDILPAAQLATLQEGHARGPTSALIAAGTGLGAAIVTRVDGRTRVLPTEAGHVDFAPRDELEMELLAYLRERHARVSAERVVSGPGVAAIYDFLRDSGREHEPAWLADRLGASEDRSAAISEIALTDGVAICTATLERFAAAYGAVVGNLALSALALGGLYLGGGIAPKILPALRSGTFIEAFRAKGRMQDLLAEVPVRVVLEPRAALLGAAYYVVVTP